MGRVEVAVFERGSGDRGVHVSVMTREVVEQLLGGRASEGWIVDATLGAGGHSAALLAASDQVRVLGIDQDPEILEIARGKLEPFGSRVLVRRSRIGQVEALLEELGIERVVGWLMDLGASSLQLDDARRGFSFSSDGPLDMRMDPDRERSAAQIVNTWDENDLADLFFYEGGETHSRRIAGAIVEARRRAPFRRTLALAELVARSVPRGRAPGAIHPATRVFQALRRAVNEEGEELEAGLLLSERWLVDGGRLVVLAFHSGEDGVVKRFLAEGERDGRFQLLQKKPLRAAPVEERRNPRSRSALLRAAERVRRLRRESAGGGRA